MGSSYPLTYLSVLGLAAGTLALAGCGDGGPPASVVRGVVTTSVDCSRLGALTLEQCQQAIQAAVALHEANAPAYPSLAACESAQGVEKCERTDANGYRPRLMAFIIVMTDPPYAEPLYPAGSGEVGFHSAGGSSISPADGSLTFSLQARAAAETFGTTAAGGGLF